MDLTMLGSLLDLVVLVVFSNLKHSMILRPPPTQEFGEMYDCKGTPSHKKMVKCTALPTTKAKNKDTGITKSLFDQLQGLIHFLVINWDRDTRNWSGDFFPSQYKNCGLLRQLCLHVWFNQLMRTVPCEVRHRWFRPRKGICHALSRAPLRDHW